jgi:hypothetical protein
MAVRPADISVLLVERIQAAHPEPAVFSEVEADEWPPGALEHLLGANILRPARRAEVMFCPGCDWQCHKPIVVRSTRKERGPQVFIVCDEEPNLGCIAVGPRSLNQYRATLAGISAVVSQLMNLGRPRSSAAGASFLLGTIRGRQGARQVAVCLDAGQLVLRVGGEQESLIRMLRWVDGGLTMDMGHVRRFARRKDRSLALPAPRLSNRIRQKERSRRTKDRNGSIFREAKKRRAATSESWSAIAATIAATALARAADRRPVSAPTVRRIITDMLRLERENSRSKHTTRS